MNTELKTDWVKALRSGEYHQGHNMMCCIDDSGNRSYCCLGVLANIMSSRDTSINVSYGPGYMIYDGVTLNLSQKLSGMSGVDYDAQVCLMGMNDGTGGFVVPRDFDTIADHIEANL